MIIYSHVTYEYYKKFPIFVGGRRKNEIMTVRKADYAIDTSCSETANWVKTLAQYCSHMLALPFHLC